MKVYLDLLPEEKKEEIKKRKIFRRIIKEEIIFSVPIVAFFIILLTTSLCLKMKSVEAGNNLASKNTKDEYGVLQKYEEKFGEINSKVSDIAKIQKVHFDWLKVFNKLNDTVPDDVYISDLATSDYGISIAGKAKTREDFLNFQEKLKSDECFSDINVPLSSLVSKENVEFQIDFKVKEDCLKT